MALSSIEQEYKEIDSKSGGWHMLFQEIRVNCDREAKDKVFSMSESGKNQNRSLNRYRDVNPYDHSRIIIHRGNTDYINANLVKMEKAERKYILTQGPLKETVGHFWVMIWEQNTKAIVMLNKLLEKKQIKCHQYWPEKMGEEHILNLTDVGLSIEYIKYEECTNFSKRTLRLTDLESKKSREVIQFHYTTWPDFSIPSSPVAFLQFLKQVRDSGALDKDVGPAVIHCSAGIGRSGTFCLVDCCLVLIEKEGENKVSVKNILYELRRYRMGLIQTADQLYFSYQAIIQGIKLLKDPNFNDYEEVPIISNEELQEETPPPLPPRTHSLDQSLPTIPKSKSLHEGFITDTNTNDVNNFINNEMNAEYDSRITRPLPPLPKQNSLEKVSESESEEDDESEDIDEPMAENNDSGLEDGQNSESIKSKEDDDTEQLIKPIQNGVDKAVSEGSESADIRRRKRIERQANIEKKVHDIKRKQREVEDEQRSSSKKRRRQKNK